MKLLLSILLYCTFFIHAFAQNTSLTGIMGAVDKEVFFLQEKMTDKKIHKIQGLTFVTGKLHGRKVVLTKTGVGKVNAAMTASVLLTSFKPTEIIFTGIAGAINPKLKLGDIVIASRTVQYDFGTLTDEGLENWGMKNPVNDITNPIYYPADTVLVLSSQEAIKKLSLTKIKVGKTLKMPTIIHGTVATGDMFVSSPKKVKELREKYKADAVEMEGAAVAQVCWQQSTPCLVIRSLSDAADENARKHYDTFINIAAANSAQLVLALIDNLQQRKP